MDCVDYTKILQPQRNLGAVIDAPIVDHVYAEGDGLHFRAEAGSRPFVYDAVRLSRNAYLFASECSPETSSWHRQVVTDGDWIHLQFRVHGSGRETIAGSSIETPERSCTVTQYTNNAIIDRFNEPCQRWRVACLFINAAGLAELIGHSAPATMSWTFGAGFPYANFNQKPMRPSMAVAVGDILACRLKGAARRTYMLGKSLELLGGAMGLFETSIQQNGNTRIPAREARRLELARSIILEQIDSRMTLDELARSVGLNRTKLAEGFRELYGETVQAFWREEKLSLARQLLLDDHRVTDVALQLGYSELSAFSRAFIRRFGVRPFDFRRTVQ